jgi:hypothetical protein
LSGTKVRGKVKANSRNQQAGETRHDARHLGVAGLDPNPIWFGRVLVSLVNRACHSRVRVGGSCRAGTGNWFGGARDATEDVRARRFLVKAPPAVRKKTSSAGGSHQLPSQGLAYGKGAQDASRYRLVKLASGENPRHQPSITPARTGRFEAEAHREAK